jgi:hypothetical protein
MNFWWIVFIAVLVPLGAAGLFYLTLKRRTESAFREMKAEYGDQIHLMTACGVIAGNNRVPGVLALLPDALAYRALVVAESGLVPLREVRSWTMTQASRSRRRRARKYMRAEVLELITESEFDRLFILQNDNARVWLEHLRRIMPAKENVE